MASSYFKERERYFICRGQLALAFAGRRAEQCGNPRCARERHCLAEWHTHFFEPMGDCANMTFAEWRAVGDGLCQVVVGLQSWHRAQDAKGLAELEKLPKAERQRRIEDMEWFERWKAEKRAELRIVMTYWEFLWVEPGADHLRTPACVAADEKRLIETAVAMGCRCAKEGMVLDCEQCEAWMEKATEAPAVRV